MTNDPKNAQDIETEQLDDVSGGLNNPLGSPKVHELNIGSQGGGAGSGKLEY
jgi:hypothetical protein